MIKIAIIDDEKEMSSILSNYVNKYAKEKNIDINMDIFQSSTDFLTNYSGYDIIFMDIKIKNDIDRMETAQGLDKGSLIGQSKEVYAWWIPVLISIDVLSGLLIAFWMFMALRRTFKKDKVISNTEQYKVQ